MSQEPGNQDYTPPAHAPARRTAPGMMLAIKIFWATAVLVLGFIGYQFFTGQGYRFISHWWLDNPHMLVQKKIRTYDAHMPQAPAGTVAVERFQRAPTTQEAQALTSPLKGILPPFGTVPSVAQDLARGRTYYQYYCAFCHGDAGRGDGPVGDSYTPRPADLRSQRVQSMKDGPLLRAMLTGPGHQVIAGPTAAHDAPVLERVVPEDYWWYLVLYVRELGK